MGSPAAGTLSVEENAELRALAETSPEAREAYEAFRPLGAEFQARVVGALANEIGQPEPKPEKQRFRLLPFRPAHVRFARWVTAAGTVAAGLFLLMRNPAPLPLYTAEASGGVKAFRGETDPEETQVFIPGSRLTLVVRPKEPVTGSVEARAFLVHGDEWVAWEPAIDVSEGFLRLAGRLGEVHPGDWKIWAVVGRPGKLPSLSELQTEVRAGRTRHAEWQAVFDDLHVLERPPP